MSHYVDIVTIINDKDSLVKALIRMGFTEEQIEIFDIANKLNDWQGNPTEKLGHIIIRKEHIGNYHNDFGFEQTVEGNYIAHIDEANGYGEEWQKKLFTYYNVERAKSEYDSMCLSYEETVDEEDRIVLRAYV